MIDFADIVVLTALCRLLAYEMVSWRRRRRERRQSGKDCAVRVNRPGLIYYQKTGDVETIVWGDGDYWHRKAHTNPLRPCQERPPCTDQELAIVRELGMRDNHRTQIVRKQ